MPLSLEERRLASAGDLEGLRIKLEQQRTQGRELALERNETGSTLLHYVLADSVSRSDRSDLIRLLVRYGTDVNSVNDALRGAMAPLHLCGFPGETNLLIDSGARIDALNAMGWTPLICNSYNSRFIGCARALMRRGANVTLVDNDGLGAEEYAVFAGNREFAQLFAAVKQAGSWRNYSNAHRIALVQLRMLCERGRARPPTSRRDPILARLFAAEPPPSSTKKAARLASRAPKRPLPNEIFRHILAFWRTDRDD